MKPWIHGSNLGIGFCKLFKIKHHNLQDKQSQEKYRTRETDPSRQGKLQILLCYPPASEASRGIYQKWA